ncbi:MAG: hypothetical protein Q4P05_06925 [Actinomycetaceae bacterium]|nr:hypothetical protein [Actinomycetaceae bacterium]
MIISRDIPVAPTPDEAREWLSDELLKPEYLSRRNWLQDFFDWLFAPLLRDLDISADTAWIVITLFILGLVVALLWWIFRNIRGRAQLSRAAQPGDDALLDPTISPEEYLQLAVEHRETDPDEAVKAAFRSIIARFDRAGILHISPGRTVGEVARTMSAEYPDLYRDIQHSAAAFNTAAYSTDPKPRTTVADVDVLLRLCHAIHARMSDMKAPVS